MQLHNLFGGQNRTNPVPVYRFGDFTREELLTLKRAMQGALLNIDKALNNVDSLRLKQEIAHTYECPAKLYDEVSAALNRIIADENNWGDKCQS